MAAWLVRHVVLRTVLVLPPLISRVHVLGVTVNSANPNLVVTEFERVTLPCEYHTGSREPRVEPRVEWKKITTDDTNFVYAYGELIGDLRGRAHLSDHSRLGDVSITIRNATRLDTAKYRCEVTAPQDAKSLGEVSINLEVQVKPLTPRCEVPASAYIGQSVALRCHESNAIPPASYYWFRDGEELPVVPRAGTKFVNSSYVLDTETGSLTFRLIKPFDSGLYHCVAWNPAGQARCLPGRMIVSKLKVHVIVIVAIVVLLLVALCIVGVWWAYKMGHLKKMFPSSRVYCLKESRRSKIDLKLKESLEEGNLRHKLSFWVDDIYGLNED